MNNCQLSPGRKGTCLLFLSLMVTLFLSRRKSPRPENCVPVLKPRVSTSLQRFYRSYVKDLCKQRRRRYLQRQSIRAVFKSEATLRSHLVRPKDEPAKQNGLVYRIPCECGEVYIGETGRLCTTESKNISETSELSVPRPPPFQHTLTTPDTATFETE